MQKIRFLTLLFLVGVSLLLTACIRGAPTPLANQATKIHTPKLSPVYHMQMRRAAHTATLLLDGNVLLAGGLQEDGHGHELPIVSAEIYDPQRNTFTPTGNLNEARIGHTATLLGDGRVLFVGGWGVNGRTASAEIYDPQSRRFTLTGRLAAPRAAMTATLLKNGKVLIGGGERTTNTPQLIAELYDPVTQRFTLTGALHEGRSAHTATLLNNGKVLLIGGSPGGKTVLASAELYDPLIGEFSRTGSLSTVRYKHAAALLKDGNVLVVGGSDARDWQGQAASAELYATDSGLFVQMIDLLYGRFKLSEAAALLPNGNVLIGGGHEQLEIFDVRHQHFILGPNLDQAYYYATATNLPNGTVLIAGGYNQKIEATDQAWIYQS